MYHSFLTFGAIYQKWKTFRFDPLADKRFTITCLNLATKFDRFNATLFNENGVWCFFVFVFYVFFLFCLFVLFFVFFVLPGPENTYINLI